MKKLFLILIAFAASTLIAQTRHNAEILATADVPLEIGEKCKGVNVSHASWFRDAAAKNITANAEVVSGDWRDMKFSVVPSGDGKLVFTFRSNFARDADRNILQNRTAFRDVKIGGKPVDTDGEFDVTFSRSKKIDTVAKKGEPIEISAKVTACDEFYGTVCADLDRYANAFPDGEKLSDIGNFDASKNVVMGMKFKIVDPRKTGGKSAVKVVSGKPLTLDFSKERAFANSIYLLWACGNDIDYTDHAVGSISVRFKNGSSAFFWIRKDRDFGISSDGNGLFDNTVVAHVADKKTGNGAIWFTRLPIKNPDDIAEIKIEMQSAYIFGLTVSGKVVQSIRTRKLDMGQWREVDMSDIVVKEGSALDLTQVVGEPNAGRYGRARVSNDGNFEFENRAGVPVKFKGTNWRPGDMFGNKIKTHADIDALAKIARRSGYNLVRWRISMAKNEFDAPYKMNKTRRDLYDYFIYAFAREGVYSHYNLASHDLGNPDFKWNDRQDVKILMFFGDKGTWSDWRKLVLMQLNHVNPYTGKVWKDDPSIVSTEYFNEIGLGPSAIASASARVQKFVDAKFAQYLKDTYKTFGAWPDIEWKKRFNLKSFDDVKMSKVPLSRPDAARFIIKCGLEMREFCENVVRNEVKFYAPLHQNNCIRTFPFMYLSADAGSYMALNVYHKHPSRFNDMGSVVGQESSFSDELGYWRAAAARRIPERPMMLSEWQHCHWNPYKYEAGIVFPAYSALQGFDNLTIHDVAIALRPYGMGAFEVSGNPVFRANEFLSSMLFLRGDVKKSPHLVKIVYGKNYIAQSEGVGHSPNAEQSKIALMTGYGVELPFARKISDLKNVADKKADVEIPPEGYSESWSALNFAATGDAKGDFDIANFTGVLRRRGILPEGNISDPSNGVFQSDTGEILIRCKDAFASVSTPKTEGVALTPKTRNTKLGRLEVKSVSVPAAVAITSVDGMPLANSRRMVFVFNTDAISSKFETSQSGSILVNIGRGGKVLMKSGKVSATLKAPTQKRGFFAALFSSAKPQNYSLYALKLNGERAQKLPMTLVDGILKIDIDTSKTSTISPFFEIVAQ